MRNIMELLDEVCDKPNTEVVSLGTGTAITMAAWWSGGKVHIAIEGKSYYSFGHYAHYSYVMEKLFNDKWQPDAEVVAEFINRLLES